MRVRALAAALTCMAALSLSGCVAAAIPVLAGGALVRSATDDRDATAEPTTPAEAQTPGATPLASGPASAPASVVASVFAPDRTNRAVTRFVNHVHAAAASPTPPLSAMLRKPAELDAERVPCEKVTATVLIDVDPAGARYAPGMVLRPVPDLVTGLAEVRASGVAVAWISEASAAHAGDLRMALIESGLDPAGRDTLLLMRYPTDRKQTRRKDLATTHCLIAIGGDERADFDELYKYLIDPNAAVTLEPLIGDGWFLLPGLIATDPAAADPASPTLTAKDTPEP